MDNELKSHAQRIGRHMREHYESMYRPARGVLTYPFLVPGSRTYSDVLWDWDSWLTNVALRQILRDIDEPMRVQQARPHEQGCILNWLSFCGNDGWIPIAIVPHEQPFRPARPHTENMHKPCLAQHAAFLVAQDGGDAEWLREADAFMRLQYFVSAYHNHHRHPCGLYYWQTDFAIGVDTDPCTFFRPPGSSGSIYLNCLMARELEAMVYLCGRLNLDEAALGYQRELDRLRAAVREHCWDERDGFFYSVDLNLRPVDHSQWQHEGMPRTYDCLIQRIGVWSGFLALWAGLATAEQAQRVVAEHYRNQRTFNAAAGVRTLSRLEKMYDVRATNNPSNWNGPVWIVSNYLTFRGLVRYGFHDDARELAEKTVRLLGRDVERFDGMHEYYQPDNGEPVLNRGFMNWNYLAANMIAWLEDRPVVTE